MHDAASGTWGALMQLSLIMNIFNNTPTKALCSQAKILKRYENCDISQQKLICQYPFNFHSIQNTYQQ